MYPIYVTHITILLHESESLASILCERVVTFQFGILLVDQAKPKCTHRPSKTKMYSYLEEIN